MQIRLDDVRFPPDEYWKEAKTPAEFYSVITNNIENVTLVSFDHDLWWELTWYDCLEWMLKTYRILGKRVPAVKLHTANPVWEERMKRLLDERRSKVIRL